jgi:hypothetical protein
MIIYWWKNLAKKSSQKDQRPTKFKSMNEMTYVSPFSLQDFQPLNQNLSLSIEDNFLLNNKSESFLSENSFLIEENNDLTIKNKKNLISKDNFKELDYNEKKELICNIFQDEKDLLLNILSIINLCKTDEELFNLIFQKINSNIIRFVKDEENLVLFKKLFEVISSDKKSDLINKILKRTNEFILDEKGHKIVLLLISFNEIRIINIILYFILQKFKFYCSNPFSSQIIIALYEKGLEYISKQLNVELIQNLNEISKFSYGKQIINEAKKYIERQSLF